MAKLPAFQFYPGDWLKDARLSMCSPASRGIWIDLMCAMHELDRSGVITGTREQLARACRCSAVELGAAIEELASTGAATVTERHGVVTVVCRRMAREHKEKNDAKIRQARQRAKRDSHGNVTSKVTLHSSSSSSTSYSEVKENTKEKRDLDGNESRDIDDLTDFHDELTDDIDWLQAEQEFMALWNSTEGVICRSRNAVPANLQREFRERWRDPHWRSLYVKALSKFPLKCGIRIALEKFLHESTVEDIIGGRYDFKAGARNDRSNEQSRSRIRNSGTDYDNPHGCAESA